MTWDSPKEAMPWVGLYVAIASFICTLAMAADVFQGFRQRKLWFPCSFFTLNAASITLIAITMKLPMDLSESDWVVKSISMVFLFTMLANFLPSLAAMDDKELFANIIALGILIITIIVNMCYQLAAMPYVDAYSLIEMFVMAFFPIWLFWVALTVPTSRRVLDQRYQELHKLSSDSQKIEFSSKELENHVKRHWVMAETGNPQFVLASSPFCSATGLISLLFSFISILNLMDLWADKSYYWYGESDYKWSMTAIVTMQLIGTLVGSIAPIFRCITTASYFELSILWSINHINIFRVEKHWTQRLHYWKDIYVTAYIPGRQCKKVFNHVKNMILNFCMALQIMLVVICKTICLVPTCIMILFFSCCHFCNSLLKWFRKKQDESNNDVRSEIGEYIRYVLQIEDEVKLTNRTLRNMLRSIIKVLHKSEKKQPRNLMKFLEKSTGFSGVVKFDNNQVPPLLAEEIRSCWSLVVVTLTAIALALPDIEDRHVMELLSSVSEGLRFVRQIEETLNINGELVKARKTARHVWTEVEVDSTWLEIDLQNKARKGKSSEEILQWLGDEAVKIVLHFKSPKKISADDSLHKIIAASSMYRISQTILLYEQENCPTDVELFEWISIVIADLLCACFTNLPRVITLKCHHDAIEKRGESIRTAAQLLGKSKTILNILEERQLPGLDQDSMAYIDKWQALPIPNVRGSSTEVQSVSSSPNKMVTVSVV